MASPMVLTLKWVRDRNGIADKTEHWNSFSHQRKDLFGFTDIVAVMPDRKGTMYIQCTTGGHLSDRKKKIIFSPFAKPILEAGNYIEIFGWRKIGLKGKRKLWDVKIEKITMEDLQNEKTCNDVDVSDYINCSPETARGRDDITGMV